MGDKSGKIRKKRGLIYMGNIGVCTTNRCNLKCSYCFADEKGSDLDPDKLSSFVKYYIENTNENRYELLLTGGEPLLYKGLKKVILNLKEVVHSIGLCTNSLLLDHEMMNFVEENNIILHISLDSLEKEYHERYRGGFDTVYGKLELLKNRNIRVMVCMTLSPGNISDVERMIAFTSDRGYYFDVNLLSLGEQAPLSWHCATKMQKHNAIEAIKKWGRYTGRSVKEKIMCTFLEKGSVSLPLCFQKKHSVCIHADGSVYPCFVNKQILYGNIYDDLYEDIMNNYKKYSNSNCMDCFCLDCLGIYD